MANVLAHQVVPGGHDDVPLSAVAHALQDLPHTQSYSSLARTGGAREAHVKRRHGRVEAQLAAHLASREVARDSAIVSIEHLRNTGDVKENLISMLAMYVAILACMRSESRESVPATG